MHTTVEQLLERKGRQTWSIRPDATVKEAVMLLNECSIGAVLVCEGTTLCGIFSERDCVFRVVSKGLSADDTPVTSVMTKKVVRVAPTDTIERCLVLMNERKIRHLPVLLGEQIVGMVSMRDVVHAMLEEKESLIEELEGYISGSPSMRHAEIHAR